MIRTKNYNCWSGQGLHEIGCPHDPSITNNMSNLVTNDFKKYIKIRKTIETIVTVFALAFIGIVIWFMAHLAEKLDYLEREIAYMDENQIVRVPDVDSNGGTTETYISEANLWYRIDRLIKANNLKE